MNILLFSITMVTVYIVHRLVVNLIGTLVFTVGSLFSYVTGDSHGIAVSEIPDSRKLGCTLDTPGLGMDSSTLSDVMEHVLETFVWLRNFR